MRANDLRHKLKGIGIIFSFFFGLLLVSAVDANGQYRNTRIWRNDPYNNRATLNRVAQTQGRNDGFREGEKDARNRKRPNPYGESRYKKATNGYKSRYGHKEAYKMAYRQAFVRGYNEGYNRNNRNRRNIRIFGRNW
jgi:hypothetical protein